MARRDVRAECSNCGKIWETKNAQGVAAIHAKATGHEVIVEITIGYIEYGGHDRKED